MSWKALVYDLVTGAFLASLTVKAADLRGAEDVAISKTALALRADPRRLVVKHLHDQGGAR